MARRKGYWEMREEKGEGEEGEEEEAGGLKLMHKSVSWIQK